MREVVLEFPARPEYLHLVRQVVAAAAELEPTFQDDRIDDLRLAVSEATTNAVEAHLNLSDDERIVVRANLAEDHIEVEVRDRAGGFGTDEDADVTPGGLPGPEEEGRLERERGLGLPLMAHLADEAQITSGSGGTSVRLTVYVPARFRSGSSDGSAEGSTSPDH